jgi:Lipocalin-like domain
MVRTLLVVVALYANGTWLSAQPATPRDQRFVGNWRLVTIENYDDKGVARPGAYTGGRIMYDAAGQMSAQLTRPDRPPLPADAGEALRAAAYASYVAYYGAYEIDAVAGKVTHKVEGSLNPNWPKTDLPRYFAFSDGNNTLKLSIRNDAGRVTGTLTWARIR